ncbi:hypothetical protein PRIPAC_81566 [Pristionchus pacificus]|uniref:Uncharacterized protein n=1 Tax=Pristionchus pacificus TaxID=54126 RepID=A0A454XYQ0_PRIPA|nr:hypothetical protein PRIPAC_81566 [Pristionchus pacificus]|eukprot:PDM65315.1 hypothetical protein PRIPAC_52257 [Pristionchus pacificus]
MRSVALLLLSVGAVFVAADDAAAAAVGLPDPATLLAKVGLSDEIIAKLKPKNVDNMNEKLKEFVKGAMTLKEACKESTKSTLCQNTLKKPFGELKTSYSSLFTKYQSMLDNATDKQKEKVAAEVTKAKALLEKLKGNSVIDFFESLKKTTPGKALVDGGYVAPSTKKPASSGSGSSGSSSGSSSGGMDIGAITDLLGSLMGSGGSGGSGINLGSILSGLGGGGSSGSSNPLGGLLSMFG